MARIGVDLIEAKSILDQGGLVAIPTETVYGLAANATDEEAVAKIFRTKNRPTFDPLIVHIHSVDQLEKFAEQPSNLALKLMTAFWPGPLTVLLKRKSLIPDLVTSGLATVAVRMPAHQMARQLLSELDYPLAAPSANPFGYISPTSAQHVQDQLGDKIDYILDGGESQVGVESTIISFENTQPTILRLGGISVEMIESIIGKVEVNAQSSSQPLAPGMLKSHYAPIKKMMSIEDFDKADIPETNGFAYLGYAQYDSRFNRDYQVLLSEEENLNDAAKNLFTSLRALDQNPHIHTIVVSYVPEVGLGRAINDRLRRATAH
ncbi:MAG: L-threonylcarbamoyladenylate synthase [Roseivirga sp.]|jgi:L-threonylcarbamoyladenylate synthase